MKTMTTVKVLSWIEARKEVRLVEAVKGFSDNKEDMDIEKLDAIFYLTLGSRRGPELFREMQCDVSTTWHLQMI
jgi:hypothetical protein